MAEETLIRVLFFALARIGYFGFDSPPRV